MTNSEIFAYVAGIVDGEGTIIITKSKRVENRSGCRFIPVIAIVNTNKDMLDFVASATGFGKVYDKANKNPFGWKKVKQQYRWMVKHSQVKDILQKILPYLVIKKKQAINALEYLNLYEGISSNYFTQEDLDKQFDYYIKSKELNGTVLTDEEKEKLRPVLREYKNAQGKCTEKDCELPHYGKGLCRIHWKRKYYAEVLKEKKPWRKDPENQPLELVS